MRLLKLLLLTTGLAAWSLALPAWAKEPGEIGTVDVTGPGLSVPIHFGPRDTEEWWTLTGLGEAKEPQPYSDTLGPKYEAVLTVPLCQPHHPQTVVQDVYPFAQAGPEVFTEEGQVVCDGPLPGGWTYASVTLLDRLIEKGLPRQAVAAASPVGAAGAPAASAGGPGWFGVATVTGAALLIAMGGAVAALRRRPRRTVV